MNRFNSDFFSEVFNNLILFYKEQKIKVISYIIFYFLIDVFSSYLISQVKDAQTLSISITGLFDLFSSFIDLVILFHFSYWKNKVTIPTLDVLKHTLIVFPAYLYRLITYVLMTLAGVLLLIAPGVYIFFNYFYAPEFMAIDIDSDDSSMEQSKNIFQKNKNNIILVIIVSMILQCFGLITHLYTNDSIIFHLLFCLLSGIVYTYSRLLIVSAFFQLYRSEQV